MRTKIRLRMPKHVEGSPSVLSSVVGLLVNVFSPRKWEQSFSIFFTRDLVKNTK